MESIGWDMLIFPAAKAALALVALALFLVFLRFVGDLVLRPVDMIRAIRAGNIGAAIVTAAAILAAALVIGTVMGCSMAHAWTTRWDKHFEEHAGIYCPWADWRWSKAQAIAESGLDPRAVSSAGARGLMQFMPATAVEMRLKNPFDPEASIDAGIRYCRNIDRFVRKNGFYWEMPDRIKSVFAGYNWGMGNLLRALLHMDGHEFQPTLPRETREYIARIVRVKRMLAV